VVSVCPAGAQDDGPYNLAARAILKELVEINTTDSSGSMTKAAEAMAARLKGAGFADADVQVIGPTHGKQSRRAPARPRHERRQGPGGDLDRQPDSIQAGRLRARA